MRVSVCETLRAAKQQSVVSPEASRAGMLRRGMLTNWKSPATRCAGGPRAEVTLAVDLITDPNTEAGTQ